ncbi:MAG: bifunctional diaminohydroxyphosphoribosylaminopyrimidine deaminase/5-amino-6-(5-phosphoribosylamino)uracil reductase RibD [Pseudomonadota bacterium]
MAAGVARVVIATRDPHAAAAGGLERLARAGVAVDLGLCSDQARWQLRGFLSRIERGRPWVRLKLAASLDGRTAMASGESQWITGEAARNDVQWLRAESDCVLTGIGTVLADNPAMTVRLSAEALGTERVRQPLRALLDSELRCPREARWLHEPGDTVIYTAVDKQVDMPTQVVRTERGEAGLSLPAVLAELAQRELNFVHLEAGATLAGAALVAGVVDELVVYFAPALLGHAARPLALLPGLEKLSHAPRFTVRDLAQIGDDVRVVLIPQTGD